MAKGATNNANLKFSKAEILKALGAINKQKDFEEGWAILMSDAPELKVETFSSGSILLDIALGGWFAKGRIVEIYGAEASWKTTMALTAAVEVQKNGGYVALIDAEQAFNSEFAKAIWLRDEQFILYQPEYGEKGFEMIRNLIATGMFDMIIVDSVSAMVPKSTIEWNIEDQQMWVQARMMSKALMVLNTEASRKKTTVVFINQTRDKIGVVYWNPTTTSGWNALKFYASQRVEVKRKEKLMEKDRNIWNRVRCIIQKNKITAPFKTAEFNVMFDYETWEFGVDTNEEIFAAAIEKNIIVKDVPKKSYYSFPDGKEIFGEPKAKAYFADENVFSEIKSFVTGEKEFTPKVQTPIESIEETENEDGIAPIFWEE